MRYAPLFARVEAAGASSTRPAAAAGGAAARTGARRCRTRLAALQPAATAFVECKRQPVPPARATCSRSWDMHALFALERWRDAARRAGARLVRGARGAGGALLPGGARARPARLHLARRWRTRAPRVEAHGAGPPAAGRAGAQRRGAARAPRTRCSSPAPTCPGRRRCCARWGPTRCSRWRARRCARRRSRCRRVQVLTSMRVKDSLERGVSYFYAEVQRIKSGAGRGAGGEGRRRCSCWMRSSSAPTPASGRLPRARCCGCCSPRGPCGGGDDARPVAWPRSRTSPAATW